MKTQDTGKNIGLKCQNRGDQKKISHLVTYFANLYTKTVFEFLADKRFSKMKFCKRHNLFSINPLTRKELFASYASTVARPLVAAQLYMNVEILVEGLKS